MDKQAPEIPVGYSSSSTSPTSSIWESHQIIQMHAPFPSWSPHAGTLLAAAATDPATFCAAPSSPVRTHHSSGHLWNQTNLWVCTPYTCWCLFSDIWQKLDHDTTFSVAWELMGAATSMAGAVATERTSFPCSKRGRWCRKCLMISPRRHATTSKGWTAATTIASPDQLLMVLTVAAHMLALVLHPSGVMGLWALHPCTLVTVPWCKGAWWVACQATAMRWNLMVTSSMILELPWMHSCRKRFLVVLQFMEALWVILALGVKGFFQRAEWCRFRLMLGFRRMQSLLVVTDQKKICHVPINMRNILCRWD